MMRKILEKANSQYTLMIASLQLRTEEGQSGGLFGCYEMKDGGTFPASSLIYMTTFFSSKIPCPSSQYPTRLLDGLWRMMNDGRRPHLTRYFSILLSSETNLAGEKGAAYCIRRDNDDLTDASRVLSTSSWSVF